MEASGAGVGVQAGGSRAAEVTSRGAGQGGVARQAGGGTRSGPARGVQIHGDGGGTRGAAATNNGAGHHGITEGPDVTLDVQLAGLADHLPANNEDHVERLLEHPLAAERELKVMGGPLMLAATLFMRSVFRAQTQPPAWVSKALQSGEEYYRARLYNTCNILAFAYALATLLVLCVYHMKGHLEVPVSAERVLTSARVTISLTIMFMTMSFSLGVCEGWRGAATMFLGMVVTTAVLILIALGELKQSVLKIGKLIGF